MVDVAEFLIEHGADVTARDKHGSTPLHQASLSGNAELANFLVEHGADPADAATSQIHEVSLFIGPQLRE
jgi:ankyrin repeat protein